MAHPVLVAPRHVESSRTRNRTCVPCVGRQVLFHCATRGSPLYVLREKDSSCEPAILAYLHMVTTVLEGENGFLKEKNHNHLPNTHTYNDLQAPKSGLIQRTVHFWSLDVKAFSQ